MAVLNNTGILMGSSAVEDAAADFQIERSLRLDKTDKAFLQRDGMMPGDRRRSTFSGWVKYGRGPGSSAMLWCNNRHATGISVQIGFSSANRLVVINWDGSYRINLESNTTYKDHSNWYHICVSFNTSDIVESERVRVWVNGERVTQWGTETYPSLDYELTLNIGDPQLQNDYPVSIGKQGSSDGGYLDGYLADIYWIDSLSLTPAAFGKFNSLNLWTPKEFALPTPNKGTTWSTAATVSGWHSTYGVDRAFNGNLDVDGSLNWAGGETCSWEPNDPIPFEQSVRIYADFDTRAATANEGWIKVTTDIGGEKQINGPVGGNVSPSGANMKWYTVVEGKGELTKIVLSSPDLDGGYFNRLYAVEVDGVILIDGKTDPTDRNNLNNGRKWSDDCPKDSGTYGTYAADVVKWFDGDLDNFGFVAASNNDTDCNFGLEFLPTGSTVEIYCYKNANGGSIEFNGTDISPPAYPDRVFWRTLTTNSSPNDTLTLKVNAGQTQSDDTGLSAFRVDGHILINRAVDNSFHLKFDDTSTSKSLGINSFNTSVSSATGALPIYNTSGDQGGTKGSGYSTDSSAGTTDGTGLVFAWPGDTTTGEVHANINTGSSAKTVTANGDPTATTNSSRFYGTSVAFDRTGDYLSVDGGSDFNFGTGDYTIEYWFMTTDNSQNQGMFVLSDTSGGLATDESAHITAHIDSSGFRVRPGNGSTYSLYGGSEKPSENTWHHIAYTRASGTFRAFLDGALMLTETGVTTSHADQYLAIGGYYDTNHLWIGNIQDFRIYKGVAKYTASFIAPSQRDFNLTSIVEAVTTGTVYGSTMKSDGAEARFYDPGGVDAYGVASRYNMFDGSTATACGNPDGTNVFEWDTTGYSFSGQLRIHGRGASSSGNETNVWVNGSDSGVDLPTSGSTSWTTIGTYNSGITSIALKPNSGGSQAMQVNAFEIDGTVITDTLEDSYTGIEVDSLTDTPTNYGSDGGAGGEVRGNYCTWNFGDNPQGLGLAQGNLAVKKGSASGMVLGTLAMPAGGKFYWEVEIQSDSATAGECYAGIANRREGGSTQFVTDYSVQLKISGDPYFYTTGDTSQQSIGAWTAGDILGLAFDVDAGTLKYYRNNSLKYTHTGISTDFLWHPAFNCGTSANEYHYTNFGQRAFKYTAPSGYLCLCSTNLPDLFSGEDEGIVNNPSKFFKNIIWQYNNKSLILPFSPDLVVQKERDGTRSHGWYDRIRGAGTLIDSDNTNAEAAEPQGLTAFNSNGFTVGTHASVDDLQVAWCWDAGTAAITPSSSYDITPSAQWANTTSGFSMTKWTGSGTHSDRVPHALGAKPAFIISKRLDSSTGGHWQVKHKSQSSGAGLLMDNNSAEDASPTNGNLANLTSNVTFGFNNGSSTADNVNASGATYITYCWAEIPGYSSFGKYTGTGAADNFTYTGFDVQFLMVKSLGSDNWIVNDKARDFNGIYGNDASIKMDYYAGEYTSASLNVFLLSNGFSINSATHNTSGTDYIYIAFAAHPFKVSRAR